MRPQIGRTVPFALAAVLAACSGTPAPAAQQPALAAAITAPAVPTERGSSTTDGSGSGAAEAKAPRPIWSDRGPLSAEATRILGEITPDPAPPQLVLGSHYWVSNESAHYVWRETIADLGGALAGVGTDQLYLLAGWQKPSLLLAMDFDAEVVRVHELYGMAFKQAETPEAFLELWRQAGKVGGDWASMLASNDADETVRRQHRRTLEVAGAIVSARLHAVKRQYSKLGLSCFVTSQADYDQIRTLWREGRVVALRGDLTATSAMVSAAAAMRKLGIPLRTLYLSNAEKYFDYSPSFRANIAAQPFDERSLILRTRHSPRMGTAEGDVYHYSTQSGENFRAWMTESQIPNSFSLLKHRVPGPKAGTSRIEDLPTTPPAKATTPSP